MRPDHWSIRIPSNLFSWIAGIAILLIMFHVVVDVAMREIVASPLDGTIEIVSFYDMVAVTFLPLAYVAHHEGHIHVELFTRGLPPRALALLEAVLGAACFAFTVWLVRETWIAALESQASGEMWETSDDLITIWPSRFLLPAGVFLMGVYMAFRIVDDFLVALGRREPARWE